MGTSRRDAAVEKEPEKIMKHVETLNEGLKRAYTLTITAKDIDARVEAELKTVAPTVRMPGFRPGKVPANLVRKMHGEALAADALQKTVQEGVDGLMRKEKLRPAMQPSVALADGYATGKDAEVSVELEILPTFDLPSLDNLTLERLMVPVDDAAVDAQIERLLGQSKRFEDAPAKHKAATGDQVIIDFEGSVDGVPFDGGKGEDMAVEIGSGMLIPGFEDQMVGIKTGESRTLNVTFPADYPTEALQSAAAQFAITAKQVKAPAEAKADDDFAKQLGLTDLDQLRGILKDQVEQEHNGLTRTHMKRKLLDQLAAAHDFPVPPSMVEAEFQQIWRQLEAEAAQEADVDAAKAELERDKDEYRGIAERRVRLGLLLSEIGQANGVVVNQQEMNRLIAQAAQQYRNEDRQRFIEYIQNEPLAAAQLRAPLFEDKVVDFLFEKATVTDREVNRAEIEAAIEADDDSGAGHVHGPGCGHDHGEAKPAKKKAAAKPAKADVDAVPAKKAPAKKAAAEPAGDASSDKPKKAPAKKAKAV
jgi:trigger factor